MPLTRAYIVHDVENQDAESLKATDDLATQIFNVCREIVPAGMNSKMGRLTPGSIEYFPHITSRMGMTVDVLIEIEAMYYKDRRNLNKRAKNIKAALKKLFPELTFAVWPKLVQAGWASDSTDPEFDGDISMAAAIERARGNINVGLK